MSKKIMVVDDNPSIIFSVKEGLELIDDTYEIIGAESGEKCLDLLKSGNLPDLILLDIMMPGMNGWDLFAELDNNSQWKKIPVVFLTAKTDVYSTGFGKLVSTDYIEKPFDLTDLKKRIDNILKRENV
ncbi:MAG: response regulator [Candidatus Thermoplasmatota archaeon]|nr:response regulator [Candidatus Thermoplasmatota archaeon]